MFKAAKAGPVEHNTFNVGVLGSNPSGLTTNSRSLAPLSAPNQPLGTGRKCHRDSTPRVGPAVEIDGDDRANHAGTVARCS